ncbi:MAG TPA: hypothetical protein V6D12_24205 [Candidatus Obscuribacterales bacterium]
MHHLLKASLVKPLVKPNHEGRAPRLQQPEPTGTLYTVAPDSSPSSGVPISSGTEVTTHDATGAQHDRTVVNQRDLRRDDPGLVKAALPTHGGSPRRPQR